MRRTQRTWIGAGAALLLVGGAVVPASADTPSKPYDVILQNGTVIDGSGQARYQADVGVRDGYIAAVGDLGDADADRELDVTGRIVAPGFIDLHSHASDDGALKEARSSLHQGVTTEFLNPDGGGSSDVNDRWKLEDEGLGINIAAYTAFNEIWREVVGEEDRRATEDEIDQMRSLVQQNMTDGAWGVSLGLDYTPAYYAETDQVIDVVGAAKTWRTNTPSHIRNEDVDVVDAVAEHIEIGEKAGLVPVITHHKVMNCCWGQSEETLALLDEANARGTYAVMDQYPYVAAQTGLSWIVPRWALAGGRDAYLERFADPELRPQIEQEIHEIIEIKVGEAGNVFIHDEQQTLGDIATSMDVTPGEATMRVLEQEGDLSSVWTFGHEDDVARIMQHPLVAVASDGGATTSQATHPRRYGTQPRVLGRYVRELGVLELEDAVRKMTGLPATIAGMAERGFIAEGMAADIAVFDPDTVIDKATFEEPAQYAEGMEYVLVNGQVALEDGDVAAQAGQALRRSTHLPSRPMSSGQRASASASGVLVNAEDSRPVVLSFDVTQDTGPTQAGGEFTLVDPRGHQRIKATRIGQVQASDEWAGFTGIGTDRTGEQVRFQVLVEEQDPFHPDGEATVTVHIDGGDSLSGTMRFGSDIEVELSDT